MPSYYANATQNLDMYLINEGKAWYLTDAGGFNSWLDPHADRIVQAVQHTIPSGQSLIYVICESYRNLIAAACPSDKLRAETFTQMSNAGIQASACNQACERE